MATETQILTTRPQRRNHLLPRSPAPLPTSPCSPCTYVEISLHSRVFFLQNEPNSRSDRTNATSCTPCHSDRRHASSVPKRRNLLQYSRYLPKRLFGPTCQRIMACIMQNEPNLAKAKTNATPFVTRNYESKPPLATRRKRTQSNPNEPNLPKAENDPKPLPRKAL
jgi:hypothetical protein